MTKPSPARFVSLSLLLLFCKQQMDANWKWSRGFNHLQLLLLLLLCFVFYSKIGFCFSPNMEGLALLRFKERVINDPYNALGNWKYSVDGELHPCSWSGIQCSHDKVIILQLRDLCLEGTLGPELGQLTHLKSLILRNNSLSGIIPKEIGELKELQILDLGCNKFSGSFFLDIVNNLPSLSILIRDNNEYISTMSPQIYDRKMLLKTLRDQSTASLDCCNRPSHSWNLLQHGDIALRRFLQGHGFLNPTEAQRKKHRVHKLSPSPSPAFSPVPFSHSEPPSSSISLPPSASKSLPLESPAPSPSKSATPAPSSLKKAPVVIIPKDSPLLTPVPTTAPTVRDTTKSNKHVTFILSGVIGGSSLLFVSVLSLLCFRRYKVTVRPWATGLSGQLQRAFVTGIPNLQRSELETACEDFSNIIGSLSDGTVVYKGTLSSGVEIAVTSTAIKSPKDWSKKLETQFRNKIDTLSKINHKNFVNLIGYCEEEVPFTRMMVFEYASNGTLFEHLHIKESEHLDWSTRLRIAMGIAYCLEYMHQLTPPIAHGNLQSSSIYLTEDYAAKVSDFSFWNEVIAAKVGSSTMKLFETQSADPESNIYNFGVILFEMITGRLPFSVNDGCVLNWALECSRNGKPLQGVVVDPILPSFREEELEKLTELVNHCLRPNPEERPRMREVADKLKEITTLGPDGATPKSSPLWWAEMEIMSTA